MGISLKDKVAIVGGSSAGIGKAVAFAFANEGCNVVICGRDKNRLLQTKNEFSRNSKVDLLTVNMNQNSSEDIKRLVNETIKRFKKIDILFTNTGGPKSGGFFELSECDWILAHEQLLLYVVRMYNEVIPIMKKQGFGRIINDTSFTVKEPLENLILSNVYRTAIVSLAKTLSREFAKYNVTINNICPGYVDTDRLKELFGLRAKKQSLSITEVYNKVIEDMPIGRLQKPEEIANLVVFLASEKSSSITGTTIQIDGGLLRGLF